MLNLRDLGEALYAMLLGAIIALIMVFIVLVIPLPDRQQQQASSISVTREEYCLRMQAEGTPAPLCK